MNRKQLLLLLLLLGPACCYADGMSGVGEAMAEVAELAFGIAAVFNIAALLLASSKRRALKRTVLVLAILMNIMVVSLCLYVLPSQFSDLKDNQYTTDIPEVAAQRYKTLSNIRGGIGLSILIVATAVGLSTYYVYSLVKRMR